MKKFDVTLPISGTLFIPDVEAETEEEAIEKAMNTSYDPHQHELMWNTEEQLVQGNVFYGELNKAYAEESVDYDSLGEED